MKLLSIILFLFTILNASSTQEQKTIAFAQDNMANDFRRAQVHEVRDALQNHKNIKFVHSDARGQTSLLIRQIEKFIQAKVDVLILGTNDSRSVVPVVKKAYDSGIAVIVLDRGINSSDYTTFINSDNIKIGVIAADYIAKRINKKGKVLLLEGLQTADVTQHRSKGFLDEITKYNEIEVIKRTGNYLRKDAIIEMEKLLKSEIKIDAIFSESDSMLSGVRTVLKKQNMSPASMVSVGCDYTKEAQEAISQGNQDASILYPLGGKMAAEVALKLVNNQKVMRHISIPVVLVTKENIDIIRPIF